MTNFDFLKNDPQFAAFADTAIAAERVFSIEYASCAINCRRAMEFAIKWMYSVDSNLVMPYQDKLLTLLHTDEFREIVDTRLYARLDFLRRLGNNANHNPKAITKDQAVLALKNLHSFLDFIAYCYSSGYTKISFDASLLEQAEPVAQALIATQEPAPVSMDFPKLLEDNKALQAEFTARRVGRESGYSSAPVDFSEAETRKAYIDLMLTDVGWEQGKNWLNEFPIENMPNKSKKGFADYVLFGDDGKPLALIEAKKMSESIEKGRHQAKLYADDLERRYQRRPIIFLSNGIKTHIIIDQKNGSAERKVSGIYSKRDLEKEFNKITMRRSLQNISINDDITDRHYQKCAVKEICKDFDPSPRADGKKSNKRKALLVMATGSGKTRTVISLVDVLSRHGWVKNILFLADRTSLVIQAKRSFTNLLPDLSTTNLVSDKGNYHARMVFSTYMTLMNKIDDSVDEKGKKLFTPGHFDLIIVDEAHRSIYNKYSDIFTYFDAFLVGLTATPKEEIDRNTYGIFDLEPGVPTHAYELSQAVEESYLVDFSSIETTLKFPHDGIIYADLTDAEKQAYEDSFTDEEGKIPEKIEPSALNDWLYNKDTIRKVLHILMEQGLKVEYGNKIGKTIIFAKNHAHAEKILELWNAEYANYPSGYCQVIDNTIRYTQDLIDRFSDPRKMPQIAISVDMLDTGIDIPEILNLVFFKKVLSTAKFWQMIGRGTRLCKNLLDGEDKKEFYIFDFCNNFAFFRNNKGKGKEAPATVALPRRIFNLKTEIVYQLQALAYQTEELEAFRNRLIDELLEKIHALNRSNFAVKLHLTYVDKFSQATAFQILSYEDTLELKEELAPLIAPDDDDHHALRFDALMYAIEAALLIGQPYTKKIREICKKAEALSICGTIPEVKAQADFIHKTLHTDYLERASLNEFEHIRENLRDLMKYIEKDVRAKYDTDFEDEILESITHPSGLNQTNLENYHKKVEHYIKQHLDAEVIAKLWGNEPISQLDLNELERILWSELGSKEDYEKKFGKKPLGELVRSIIGLDKRAAKEAFSKFDSEYHLDAQQMYFVNHLINYIVKNGTLNDLSIFGKTPFNDKGSIYSVFPDLLWDEICATINRINANANVA